MLKLAGSIAALILAATGTAGAASITAYSNTFDSAADGSQPTGISGAGTVQGTQGYSGITGFNSKFLRNDASGNPATATRLTLTGLQAHSSINLGFLLAIIDSWDGTGCCSPDHFSVSIGDGSTSTTVFSEIFDNFNSGGGQTFAGAPMAPRSQLGFDGGYNDAAYDLTSFGALQNIAHTGSTLVIDFFAGDTGNGFQGGNDESWALDNLTVVLNGVTVCTTDCPTVPEPASLALFGAGLMGLAALRRRKR